MKIKQTYKVRKYELLIKLHSVHMKYTHAFVFCFLCFLCCGYTMSSLQNEVNYGNNVIYTPMLFRVAYLLILPLLPVKLLLRIWVKSIGTILQTQQCLKLWSYLLGYVYIHHARPPLSEDWFREVFEFFNILFRSLDRDSTAGTHQLSSFPYTDEHPSLHFIFWTWRKFCFVDYIQDWFTYNWYYYIGMGWTQWCINILWVLLGKRNFYIYRPHTTLIGTTITFRFAGAWWDLKWLLSEFGGLSVYEDRFFQVQGFLL